MLYLILLACAGGGPKDSAPSGAPDADGDGYLAVASGGDDCDDANAAIHPGATEVCDAADADEDCDGLADDADEHTGGTLVWPDADGDGYGTGDGETACDPPDDVATQGEDCDDTRADVHPGGNEVCDDADADEDCDGRIDNDDDSSAADTRRPVYADADGDGYGGAQVGLRCDPEAGETLDATDCDDDDPAVNPGAPEVCDDADVDENCNGLADDQDPTLDPTSAVTVYDDDDGDGAGAGPAHPTCDPGRGDSRSGDDCDDTDPALNRADADHDGVDTCGGDCNDFDPARSPALAEVCDDGDVDEDCDGVSDDADPSVDVATLSVWEADADGDGYGTGATYTACDATRGDATRSGDCDDTDASLTPADSDGDGVSSCDGDCNDRLVRVYPWDEDGDGLSPCDGDCDDADPAITEGCSYTELAGRWEIPALGCAWLALGTPTADLTLCPDCEFAFHTESTRESGSCPANVEAFMGFDQESSSLSLQWHYFSSYYELGPFPASLTSGTGYDVLRFNGYSPTWELYSGDLYLY